MTDFVFRPSWCRFLNVHSAGCSTNRKKSGPGLILGMAGLCGIVSYATPALSAPDSSHNSAITGTMLDHPRLSPGRDVVVTYHFQAAPLNGQGANDGNKRVKVYFTASGDRLRVEQLDGPGITILDRPSRQVTLISTTERSYVQFLPAHGIRNPFLLDISMHYKAGEMKNIAGTPCRQWSIESGQGHADACVTDDGVILAESGIDADGLRGKLEAEDVSYRDIPASLFEAPADFHKIMPHMVQMRPEKSGQAGAASTPADAGQGATGQAATGSSPDISSSPEGMESGQPRLANDSSSDGTTQHADQPGGQSGVLPQ